MKNNLAALENVFHYLNSLSPMEPKDLEPLVGKYKTEFYRAKKTIFKEGEHYRKVTFIVNGLVKKYYLTSAKKEFIKEFTWEGQITTPYASLLKNTASTYTMRAIEDTTLL